MSAHANTPAHGPAASTYAMLRRWLGRGRETHISLPLFALLLLVAIWMVTAHFVRIEQAAAQNAARDSVRELIDTYEAQLGRSLGGIDQTLKLLKYVVELKGPAAALPALNEKGLLPSGLVFAVAIANRDGLVVASNPPVPPADLSGESYFRFHRDSESVLDAVFVSETMRGSGRSEAHVHFTRRLNDARGRFAGIVIVEADPAYFTSGYEHSRQGEHGVLALAGFDGAVRALRSGDKVSWGQMIRLAPVESPAAPSASPWDGVSRYTSVRPLHGFPLSALVALDRDEQFAPFAMRRRTYLWGAAIASVLLALIVTLVCVWSWQLERTQRRSRRAQETFAAASEASMDAFFVMRSVSDAGGTIVDFIIEATNGRAQHLAGRSGHDLIGATMLSLMPGYRDNGIFDDMVDVVRFGGMREAEWRGET